MNIRTFLGGTATAPDMSRKYNAFRVGTKLAANDLPLVGTTRRVRRTRLIAKGEHVMFSRFAIIAAGAVAAGLAAAPASAGIITATNPTIVTLDNSTATLSFAIATSGSILDVNVTIDFAKCDDPYDASQSSCNAPGFSFNEEIVFRLTSPDGTTVNLVNEFTYGGQTPGDRVTVTFDDSAASVVGGDLLQSGSFRPVGSLGDFIGEDALGIWMLFLQDTAGGDPLGLYSFTVEITVPDVPEPGTMALLGAGLLGLGIARRRPTAA